MKRYLAFACPYYYPSGGMQDCVGAFDTIDEAKATLQIASYGGLGDTLTHGHIFDLESADVVFAYDNEYAPNTECQTDILDIDFNKENKS